MKSNKVLDGLFGLCIGDALGLPVQFLSREVVKRNPVTNMIGYGQFNLPPGSWSDDSSLTFCLSESLCNGYDIKDIADKFIKWLYEGYWTPFGQSFDKGQSTINAIERLKSEVDPLSSGDNGEYNNGNGSLMRILPLAYYLEDFEINKRFEIVHQISSITHAHPRSQVACGIYIQMCINLLKGSNPRISYVEMKRKIFEYYRMEPFKSELKYFSRILTEDISRYKEQAIRSSGYVIDTLEASLWCLINNDSYTDTVLKAVNLGEDTDTTGSVVGGLAGIVYGLDNIPKKWIDQIIKKDEIIDLANRLNSKISIHS